MSSTPKLSHFQQVVAESRPEELAEIAPLLASLSHQPRVGVCSIHSPLSLGQPLAGARHVDVAWPDKCSGADVIFLVHPGPLSARMRDRIAAGPAHFELVHAIDDIRGRWERLDAQDIAAARARHLLGQLRALHSRHPAAGFEALIAAVRADIAELAGGETAGALGGPQEELGRDSLTPTGAANHPRQIAVVGPDSPCKVEVERAVAACRGFTVVGEPGPEVEAVVAVAPATGWTERDLDFLRSIFGAVGRVISCGPAPTGIEGVVSVARAEELGEEIRRLCIRPAWARLPQAEVGRWASAAQRMDYRRARERRRRFEQDPVAACVEAGLTPPRSLDFETMCQIVVMTFGAYLGLGRLLGGPMVLIGVAVVVLLFSTAKLAQRRKNWARGQWPAVEREAQTPRRAAAPGMGTGRAGDAAAGSLAWIRCAIAREVANERGK